MGLLTRRTGNSTHPGPAYTSSAHPARPTHPADPYHTYPSHYIHPTDPAEPYPIHPASPYPTHSSYSAHPTYPTHPAYLYPTHSTHRAHPIYPSNPTQPTSPSYDPSSSSVDIQRVHQFTNSWVTPVSRFPEGQLIRRGITFPHESLEQPIRTKVARRPKLRTPRFTGRKKSRGTTIKLLPEDILLEIFDFCRLNDMGWGRPWKWLHLAHVCRKWRHALTVSPRRLDLQILCRPGGAPIESIMDAWSTLPLSVLCYDLQSGSLSENIIVALRRPDRVYKVDLTLSSSLIGSIVPMMQEPFPKLESIQITVQDTMGPPLAFRGFLLGGSTPRVRDIHLDRVAIPFPAIRQVLSSTNSLVKLQLLNIPNDAYFPPVDLVNALSTLIHLESLMFGFRSPASRPPQPLPPPSTMTGRPCTTTTLSSLTNLNFCGAHEYLEEFISQIDLPSLREMTIKLFNQILFEIPHSCQFISRLKALGYSIWVRIAPTKGAVEVTFEHIVTPRVFCSLTALCLRLDYQLSFVTQLMTQLSPLVRSKVQILRIGTSPNDWPHMPPWAEDVDSGQWLELFQLFRNVRKVHVMESGLVPDIVQALVTREEEEADENMVAAGVLPELTELSLNRYDRFPSVLKDVKGFVSARRRANRTIDVRNWALTIPPRTGFSTVYRNTLWSHIFG
jgi:F-box associated protein